MKILKIIIVETDWDLNWSLQILKSIYKSIKLGNKADYLVQGNSRETIINTHRMRRY